MDGLAAATNLLARAVETPSQASTAWRILSNEGLELTSKRGRRDLRSMARLLGKHLTLSAKTNSYIIIAERYRQWVLESNQTFWVPGLNVRLPIKEAWDELLLNEALLSSPENKSMTQQISRYHEWERLAETARRDSETCRAEGAVIGKERLVIIGGPSSGKSTLGRQTRTSTSKRSRMYLRLRAIDRRKDRRSCAQDWRATHAVPARVCVALAKDMLRGERPWLAEAAERVGYQSASAFSTTVTRLTGHSPGKFARYRA